MSNRYLTDPKLKREYLLLMGNGVLLFALGLGGLAWVLWILCNASQIKFIDIFCYIIAIFFGIGAIYLICKCIYEIVYVILHKEEVIINADGIVHIVHKSAGSVENAIKFREITRKPSGSEHIMYIRGANQRIIIRTVTGMNEIKSFILSNMLPEITAPPNRIESIQFPS